LNDLWFSHAGRYAENLCIARLKFRYEEVLNRVGGARCGRRPSFNHQQPVRASSLRRTTVNTLWEHYSKEELPLKALSTQDAYTIYTKKWIIPRWGDLPLEEVKTVEVERWLRATDVADGTKATIKSVMSAFFCHAVRWEFCSHNPAQIFQ